LIIARLFAFYDACSKRGWHAAVILIAACAILLVRWGDLFSVVLGLIAYTGCAALIFDPPVRRDLVDPRRLGLAAALVGAIVVWQILGVAVRRPFDAEAFLGLGSVCGIALLLPVFAAALRYHPGFARGLLAVLFTAGSLAALISLVRHGMRASEQPEAWREALLSWRLVPIGRAHQEILGAGGLISALFAGLALGLNSGARLKAAVIPGLAVILLAVALTQSRGPIIALCLALGATFVSLQAQSPGRRLKAGGLLALVCVVVPVLLVVEQARLQALFCESNIGLCRNSSRQEVWATVLLMIPERPWFGIGPKFRFPEGSITHPHSGFLGSGFFFGIPVALLFVALIIVGLAGALRARGPGGTYALLGIFFSLTFMATDQSNPFAFINAHLLFLWYPLFLGLVLGSRPQRSK
jgi:O-antigen ligase